MSGSVIDRLGLEGHDSELFSFLEAERVEELRSHPSASTPLWTFGEVVPETVGLGTTALMSVTYWNSRPSCLAFNERPDVEQCEPHNGKPSEWHRYRGFTTNDLLIQVNALVLVRYLFVQGYTCALDDRQWIPKPADPGLDRLSFIRGWVPQRAAVKKESAVWCDMKIAYYRWAFEALNQVPTALGVAKMSSMVDRCVGETKR
jgi:hypothetical protein